MFWLSLEPSTVKLLKLRRHPLRHLLCRRTSVFLQKLGLFPISRGDVRATMMAFVPTGSGKLVGGFVASLSMAACMNSQRRFDGAMSKVSGGISCFLGHDDEHDSRGIPESHWKKV